MAARTTSKAKLADDPRSPAKVTAVKKTGARKAPAKSAKAKPGKKSGSATVKGRPAQVAIDRPIDAMAAEMLVEQNTALRAELEQAQARITELEELNKNVVNRIDWVIDSLQSALKR